MGHYDEEMMSSFCRLFNEQAIPWVLAHTNKQQRVALTTKRCFSTGFGFIKKNSFKTAQSHSKGDSRDEGTNWCVLSGSCLERPAWWWWLCVSKTMTV